MWDTLTALVISLASLAEWVEVPPEKIEALLSDPDDNVIVACAVEGKANYLVTYDPHFDSLNGEFRGIKILKAIPFLEILREENDS
ncbi:MAG: PIN domain-containing protein [Anaerolineales bacterium]|nr:PIN domain-containing protein [Anaerolineales bacterium]